MNIAITRASEIDLDPLIDLMAAFYSEADYAFDDEIARVALARLLGDRSLGAAWTFRDGESLAGYLVVTFGFSLEFHGRCGIVDELFVLPEHRGQGLGAAALAVAEDFCRDAGVGALRLEVEHENATALALYRKQGFREHPRHLMTKWLALKNID
ncbi:MAG TPA: GNAT family N-acetyltransferase [Thermoanaerobaculia bacterium]|nr:GNAT family N-acetyltransferase [Thermoanaerobaculia bacterium]